MEPTSEPTIEPTLAPTMQPTIGLCPALQSYVEYIISNVTYTALSINVNWSPYKYLLNENEIILFPNNENVCNINTIITDLSNKVILIRNNINLYNCSQQEWILNLQNKSALGVLIWDQEILNYINPINGNNNLSNPIIPTRVISYDDGFTIYNNINNNNNVTVIFGCFNDSSPINLCITDTGPGSSWDIDGDYQRIADVEVNNHPVWQKEEYGGNWGPSRFIYLLADNEYGWKWIITFSTTTITSFSQIQNNTYNADAYCNILNSSTSDPGSCNDWYIYDYASQTSGTWKPVDYVTSIDGLCDPLDNELFCLESKALNQEPYNKFVGLYHQAHISRPEWYKVVDPTINNDTTANVIIFDCLSAQCFDVGWLVIQVPAITLEAVCIFGTIQDWFLLQDKDTTRYRLDDCTDWRLVENGLLTDATLEWYSGACGSNIENSSFVTCGALNSFVNYVINGAENTALSTQYVIDVIIYKRTDFMLNINILLEFIGHHMNMV